jgi:effector-binding domain-containing protein
MKKIDLFRWGVLPALLFTRALFPQEEAPKKAEEISLKTVEPVYYAALEMTGSYDQHEKAFQVLYEAAGTQGLDMTAMPFGIYWNSPEEVSEKELKWEVGLPLTGKKELAEPLVVKHWEFTQMAVMIYEGVFDGENMGKAYGRVFQWIGENGYIPAGPILETYLSMPVTNDKGETSGKVEIAVPVQKNPDCEG